MPDVVAQRWQRRLIALVVITALGYLSWRGYQQPEMLLEFGNLRFC